MDCCVLDTTTLQKLLMNGTQRVALVNLNRLSLVSTILTIKARAICLAVAQLYQANPHAISLMASKAVRLVGHAAWRAIEHHLRLVEVRLSSTRLIVWVQEDNRAC